MTSVKWHSLALPLGSGLLLWLMSGSIAVWYGHLSWFAPSSAVLSFGVCGDLTPSTGLCLMFSFVTKTNDCRRNSRVTPQPSSCAVLPTLRLRRGLFRLSVLPIVFHKRRNYENTVSISKFIKSTSDGRSTLM
jgi:hypothetical protein